MNTRIFTRTHHAFKLVVALAAISLLSACGGDDAAVVNANPTGYYTGDADVYDGDGMLVDIQDLQGLVDGNRFMAMSEINELLYDGTITSISGNNFSATVKVYQDGVLVTGSVTAFTGQIAQGSQITGTFSGTDDWRGTFTLAYAASNTQAATPAQVETAVNEFWGGATLIYDEDTDPGFDVSVTGVVSDNNGAGIGVLWNCTTSDGGTITPVANTRLYRVVVEYHACGTANVDGAYTGLATTKDSDGKLVWMITKSVTTNGDFANASDYIRRTIN